MVTGVFQFPADFESALPSAEACRTASSDSFVSGPENWMLHYALHRLLTLPERHQPEQNPLVTWGASGTGKSMLLHALADYWARLCPKYRLVRVHAADWARGGEVDQLGEEHRSTGNTSPGEQITSNAWFDPQITTALFIDDVHQLVGRPAAQLRLAFIIDAISQAQGLVFVTCRSHPAANSGLLPPLVSRLMAGVSLELHAPGPEARAVIVQRFATASGWRLSNAAAAYAAQQIDGSVRELRQSLSRCLPVRPLSNQAIGADELQSRLAAGGSERIASNDVLTLVGRQFGVTVAAQKSASRRRGVVLARSVSMYLLRKTTRLPLGRIGDLFGGRDHTTVLHACRKIEQQIQSDTELNRFVRETTTKLRLRNADSRTHIA